MQLSLSLCLSVIQQSPGASQYSLSGERYLSSSAELFDVASGESIDGSLPGVLIANFSYKSLSLNLATGGYLYEPLDFIWSIETNGVLAPGANAGGWFGAEGFEDEQVADPMLLSFSEGTGVGKVQIRIPFGQGLVPHYSFPLIPEGASMINVVVGKQGVLTVSPTGQVSGSIFSTAIPVQSTYPGVWIQSDSPISGPGNIVVLRLFSNIDNTVQRSYIIPNPNPGIVEFLLPTGGASFRPSTGGHSGGEGWG